MLLSMKKRTHLALSLVLFMVFSVMTTFTEADPFGIGNGYNLPWLAVLYIWGAYFRLHPRKYPPRLCALVLVGTLLFMIASRFLLTWATFLPIQDNLRPHLFMRYVSPTTVLMAICLFLLLKDYTPRSKTFEKAIIWLAPHSLAVYVIHVQPIIVLKGGALFGWIYTVPWYMFPFACIGAALILYIFCLCVEMLRVSIFKALRVERALEFTEQKILSLWRKTLQKSQCTL